MSNSVCLYVLYTNQQFVILSYQTLHTLYYYPNLNFSNISKFFKPPCHGHGSKNPLIPYISASSECIIFPSLTLGYHLLNVIDEATLLPRVHNFTIFRQLISIRVSYVNFTIFV